MQGAVAYLDTQKGLVRRKGASQKSNVHIGGTRTMRYVDQEQFIELGPGSHNIKA